MPDSTSRAFLLIIRRRVKTIHLSMKPFAIILVFCAGVAQAADIAVSDDASVAEQSRPRIAVAPSHGFVVVWEDKRSGLTDIYCQRFDEYGYAVGANRRITDDTIVTVQRQPSISIDYSGNYQSVWLDYRLGSYPLGPQVFGQRLNATGDTVGANTRFTTEPPDSLKAAPDVALSPNGTGLIVWEDYRNRNWDIYAQRINSSGQLVGSNFKINDDLTAAQQHAPRVAASPDGWFVVTWYDNRWGNDDIFVQRLDGSANKLGVNFKVNSDAGTSRQAFPDVAADGVGYFTVVWTDWRNGTYPNNADIFARKFDTLFVPVANDTRVNRDGSLRTQKDPSIAADRLGNVGIVWSDSGATSFDISGQMIDVDGKVREANFRANAQSDSGQILPDIALDGRKRYVCWSDYRKGNWDIYASITQYNDPTLVAAPAALSFSMLTGAPLPTPAAVVIDHTGYNRLQYRAVLSAEWLLVSPDSGQTVDTLSVSVVDSSMATGTYTAHIMLVDITNHDSSASIPVVFRKSDPIWDTLMLGSLQISDGRSGGVSIDLRSPDSLDTVYLGVKAAIPGILTFDSVTIDSQLSGISVAGFSIDSVSGEATVVFAADSGAPLKPGNHRLGQMWVTGFATGYTEVGKGEAPVVVTTAGKRRTPALFPGEVQVDEATAVETTADTLLPASFSLGQNYPNPFNGFTTISFDIPVAGRTVVDVFNILGQQVSVLLDAKISVGHHTVDWAGRDDRGRELPSGVYFYRLRSGEATFVKKMVYLK